MCKCHRNLQRTLCCWRSCRRLQESLPLMTESTEISGHEFLRTAARSHPRRLLSLHWEWSWNVKMRYTTDFCTKKPTLRIVAKPLLTWTGPSKYPMALTRSSVTEAFPATQTSIMLFPVRKLEIMMLIWKKRKFFKNIPIFQIISHNYSKSTSIEFSNL